MAEFSFNCPQCGHEIMADDSVRGTVAECPYCKKGIVVPRLRKIIDKKVNEDKDKTKDEMPETDNKCRSKGNQLMEAIIDHVAKHKKGTVIIGGFILFVMIGLMLILGKKNSSLEFNHQKVDNETCQIAKTQLDISLSNLTIGMAYMSKGELLQVVKVIPKEGVMVTAERSPMVFIRTQRDYVDGSHLMPGLYVCLGSLRYKDESGSVHTVRSLCEMEESLAHDRIRKILEEEARIEAKRKAAEEQARLERQKLEQEEKEKRIKAEQELARKKAEKEIQRAKEAAVAAAKAEAERIKRYPEEQRIRKEYAMAKLSVIKFDVAKYFTLQNALKKYIRTAQPTEALWQELQELQRKGDWLGMMNKGVENPLKDYPDISTIDVLCSQLLDRQFHMEFQWTCHLKNIATFKINMEGEEDPNLDMEKTRELPGRIRRRRRGSYEVCDGMITEVKSEDLDSRDGVVIPFSLDLKTPIHLVKVHAYSDSFLTQVERFWDSRQSKLRKDQDQGRLTGKQYDDEIMKLKVEIRTMISKTVSTSVFKLHSDEEKHKR